MYIATSNINQVWCTNNSEGGDMIHRDGFDTNDGKAIRM